MYVWRPLLSAKFSEGIRGQIDLYEEHEARLALLKERKASLEAKLEACEVIRTRGNMYSPKPLKKKAKKVSGPSYTPKRWDCEWEGS